MEGDLKPALSRAYKLSLSQIDTAFEDFHLYMWTEIISATGQTRSSHTLKQKHIFTEGKNFSPLFLWGWRRCIFIYLYILKWIYSIFTGDWMSVAAQDLGCDNTRINQQLIHQNSTGHPIHGTDSVEKRAQLLLTGVRWHI